MLGIGTMAGSEISSGIGLNWAYYQSVEIKNSKPLFKLKSSGASPKHNSNFNLNFQCINHGLFNGFIWLMSTLKSIKYSPLFYAEWNSTKYWTMVNNAEGVCAWYSLLLLLLIQHNSIGIWRHTWFYIRCRISPNSCMVHSMFRKYCIREDSTDQHPR